MANLRNTVTQMADNGSLHSKSHSGMSYEQYQIEHAYLDAQTSNAEDNKFVIPSQYPIVNAPFIKLDLLQGDGSAAITSLSWKGEGPDYFTSLSHKRILHEACQCTLNLSYVPNPGEDPSLIEAAIWKSKGRCKYQYGLTGYKSPVYSGLIYDYSVSMSEGRLDYKMDLISQEISYLTGAIKDAKFNIPPIKDRIKYRKEPWKWVRWAVEKLILFYFNDEYYFEDCVYTGDYDGDAEACPYELQSSQLDFVGTNPIQALYKIAKHLYPRDGNTSTLYYIQFDDEASLTDYKGKVKLMSTSQVVDKSSVVGTYSFLWNHRDSSVISWNPEYKGTAVIFNDTYRKKYLKKSTESDEGHVAEYAVQSDGSYLVDTMPNKKTLRAEANAMYGTIYGSDFEDVIQDNDELIRAYNEITRYPYKATLTVMGLPADFVIGDHLIINPYLNGILHHTGGEYMIQGITDNVSSSGFTTELNLVRVDTTIDLEEVEEKEEGVESKRTPLKPGRIGTARIGTVNFVGNYNEVK